MSDTLKIWVLGVTRRALTRDEGYAYATARSAFDYAHDAKEFLDSKGAIYHTYHAPGEDTGDTLYGSMEFRTLRDAYVDEIEAWHAQQIGFFMSPDFAAWNQEVAKGAQLLEGKEIVLEVVKGGDAHDD